MFKEKMWTKAGDNHLFYWALSQIVLTVQYDFEHALPIWYDVIYLQ